VLGPEAHLPTRRGEPDVGPGGVAISPITPPGFVLWDHG
jgi:hypothetical protein